MKFKPYFTILCLLQALFAKAQHADTAQAIVHYKFTHLRDTMAKDKPYTENMILLIGSKASVYKSLDRKLQEERMRKSIQDQLSSGSASMGGGINLNAPAGGGGSSEEYFQFPNENKFVTKERLVNNYLVHESMPAISWKISADTASFSGLACQKATTHFKGRDYVAWFCADLPYRAGPWKLNGLPGLIVEAYDTKKEVVFKFDGLEKVDPNAAIALPSPGISAGGRTVIMAGADDGTQNPNLIALPKNGIKASAKEISDLKELRRRDPQAFIQTQMAAMQAQMGVSVRGFSGTPGSGPAGTSTFTAQRPSTSATIINNPIELPEKK